MKPKESLTSGGYRIGAVSRITGITPETLRVWERRYGVVAPERSPGGGRIYFPDDIARLQQIKQLVDGGDSISAVATLDYRQLLARVSEISGVMTPVARTDPCRVIVVGLSLSAKMNAAREWLYDLTVVACYNTLHDFESAIGNPEADILIIEQPTLQRETAVCLAEWITLAKAAHAVFIYRFATQETLHHFPRSRCSTLQAPLDAFSVQSHCHAIMSQHHALGEDSARHSSVQSEVAPPRRFDEEELARIAAVSSTVNCECPKHLAELLTSLSAFEHYSIECESRNSKDAALHAYLNTTAARARHMIELALLRIIESEKIVL